MHNHSNGNEVYFYANQTIFLTTVEHQDSLRNRDKQKLGIGPLVLVGAYHLAKKSGNFGLRSNGKAIFRKIFSEIVDNLQR